MALKGSGVKKSIASRLADAALAAGNGVVSFVSGVLALALVLYSGYVLYDTFHTEYEAYSSVWDLMKYKPVTLPDGDSPLGELSDTVKDYCAWHAVPNDFFEGDAWLDEIERMFRIAKPMMDFMNAVIDDYE